PLSATHRRHRGQRAAEAASGRKAREAPRLAARQDRRAPWARVQTERETHARGPQARAPLPATPVALLGLPSKPNTNDMREAPSLVLASRLMAEGATVRGWDPVAHEEARAMLPSVEVTERLLDALKDADAAVIVTEWSELAGLLTPELRDAMRKPVIRDGRNLSDPSDE